jgi:hypothetical protein
MTNYESLGREVRDWEREVRDWEREVRDWERLQTDDY